ncbi:MFS transporter [Labrys monachus]|uniref:Sugar phosphate permease n=1 Tax=Labrys monachus TaxID=217067 RepID=A0ABU0FE15_9HYPH|nr:MFS transporter [Labrys monachus]MDQ0392671.1 sugar phosphate permease [Labrys monachus]
MVFLIAAGVLNYIDRATLSVANPLIRADLGIDVAQMGLLLSAFLWAYAFAQLPAGALIDRVGPRLMLTCGLTVWSLAQVLGGIVLSFWQFIGARVLLGLGEAPHFPTCARVARDWFNIRQRGTATGLWNCASSLGTAVAVPILTAVMFLVGWRWMFVVMGAVGIVLALVIYSLFRNPSEVDLTPGERDFLSEGDDAAVADRVSWDDWKRLFAFRTTWGMIAGFFGTIYVLWIYTAWLPGYLEMERHFTISKTGIVGAIPFVFGVVGSIFGGWLVDYLARRGVSPLNARKYPMAASLLLTAIFTAVAAETPNDSLAIGCISVSLFLLYISSSAAWAMASVAAPANTTASIGSMQNFGGYVGGALAPTVTGFIVKASGSFVPALLTGAVIAVVAAILYMVLIDRPIPARDAAGLRAAS